MTLVDLGWNDRFEKEFARFREQGLVPARLIRDNKISYGALFIVDGEIEEREVIMSGRVYHEAQTDAELPAVGDWVALDVGGEDDECVIRARLQRQSCFSRKAAGHSAEEQVIAANVGIVVVVTDAGEDFSPRRMERYFTLIARSGARAVVLVNKCDLFPASQCEAAAEQIRKLNADADVHLTSVKKRRGLRVLKQYFQRGETLAFIGSSGVGKSAMVNYILGDDWQWTDEVNEITGKGRHTTTARELLILPKGGIIIDNPGIKEVQMWTDEQTLRERFAEIDELACQCQFHDCKHGTDKGCAIRVAVETGRLDAAHYKGYLSLEVEIENLRHRRRKRQMTLERRAKRDHKIKARNKSDRQEIDQELRPRP